MRGTRFGAFVVIAFSILVAGLGREGRASAAGQSADVLIPFESADRVRVSPDGRWIAARGERGRGQGVLVQRVGLRKIALVGQWNDIRRVVWEGPDSLLVESVGPSGAVGIQLVALRVEEDEIRFERIPLPSYGWLVDATPLEPGSVIWELEVNGRNSLHRIPLEEIRRWRSSRSASGFSGDKGKQLASVPGSVIRWILDRSGNPVAAWRREEDGHSILVRKGGRGAFEIVHRFSGEDATKEIVPWALSSDERALLVLAHAGGDFIGLHELDFATGQIGKAVFRPEQADVAALVVDDLTREPILAWYTVAGERKAHYFDVYRDRFLAKLDSEWDRRSISIVSASADRSVFVFYVSNATNPGEYFFRDSSGAILSIAKVGLEIDRSSLAPVESLVVRSKDGLEVEAFLARPRSTPTPVPLVVMPHGGPIGVRDLREYDPIVQYLASWGFAVLQINYRGSTGYGVEFEKLGRKQWAKGIEDDIDAAIEVVMKLPEIDEDRICIIGGSYGGFSALASVIRHEARYRCAVTINGVTDIPLLADSSDIADSKRALELFEEGIGSLETEREKLLEISPTYRVADVKVPILIVQGLLDRRVDPDHAYRLATMLELHQKDHEVMYVERGEHSFSRTDWIQVLRRVRRFLTAKLMPGTTFVQDPESAREARSEVLPGQWAP